MNSGHDLGGMMGFGPIENDPSDPNFHADWEQRVFALTLAVGATGSWSIDTSRHARESLPPHHYLSSSYYRIWLDGLEKLMLNAELVNEQEIEAGKQSVPAKAVKNVLTADKVMPAMMSGSPYDRESQTAQQFAVGETVKAKNMHPQTHTRIPRYVRGKTGVVDMIHGCHVFPDSNAQGLGEDPQWLYRVKFTASEIWGDEHSSKDMIFVDLWEPYLE